MNDRHLGTRHARQRLELASIVAWLSSGFILLMWWLLIASEVDDWWSAAITLVRAAGVSLLAWRLWARESPWAAWLLGVSTAGSLVIDIIMDGSLLPAIIGTAACVVYYRAWQAAEELSELRRAPAPPPQSASAL